MQPTDAHAFLPEQIAQHPAASERIEQVQLVDPPHDRQVGVRHRPRQIVDAAAADAELLCLAVAAVAVGLERAEAALFGATWLEALVLAILVGTAVRTTWSPGRRWPM